MATYVDEGGYAYGLCAFKVGKPEYYLMHKRAWERHEQVQAVFMDASLSESERKERVGKSWPNRAITTLAITALN